MDANKRSIGKVFDPTVRLVAPLFQRPYVWERRLNWVPLWDGIRDVASRRLDKGKVHPHFLGAIVLDQMPNPIGTVETRQIIDGQQRLTTLQVALAAARDVCQATGLLEHREAFHGLVRNVLHLSRDPDDEFKVWPTNVDRVDFRRVITSGSMEALRKSYRLSADEVEFPKPIPNAYEFFYERVEKYLGGNGGAPPAERALALYHAVKDDLQIVVIELDEGDDAQEIFETLNFLGTPLLPADLVKNYLFHAVENAGEDVEALHQTCWADFDKETEFWRQKIRQGRLTRYRLDLFLQYYLSLMTRDDILVSHLFSAFKDYASRTGTVDAKAELSALRDYSAVYRKFSGYPLETYEGQFFYRLDLLDTSTVYPLLLEVFQRMDEPKHAAALRQILGDIESFLIRRTVCRLTAKNYNRFFLDVAKNLAESAVPGQNLVRSYLLEAGGESTKWPSDKEFREAMRVEPLYRTLLRGRLRAILEALELHLHSDLSERLKIMDKLTIEHIMPRAWEEHWPLPKHGGEAAREAREFSIHRLGNLTLLTKKLNPKLSNGPWVEKRKAIGRYSRLNLSADLAVLDEWNVTTIEERGEVLIKAALEVWPRPKA